MARVLTPTVSSSLIPLPAYLHKAVEQAEPGLDISYSARLRYLLQRGLNSLTDDADQIPETDPLNLTAFYDLHGARFDGPKSFVKGVALRPEFYERFEPLRLATPPESVLRGSKYVPSRSGHITEAEGLRRLLILGLVAHAVEKK